MSRQRYFIILGLAAFVVTSQAPPASASIFGDALRVVKKTTKKAVGVVRDVTGISAPLNSAGGLLVKMPRIELRPPPTYSWKN